MIAVPVAVAAAQTTKSLSVDEAVHHAIRNSTDIRDVKTDRIKKVIERREAIDAINIARRREKYPWFTLLMTINLPQKHTLPREIELLMKIPQINSDIELLKKKETYAVLNARHDAYVAYYDVLLAKYTVDRTWTYINETRDTLERINRQYRIGLADQKDVEYLEGQLNGYQTALKKAVQDLEKNLDKLSKLTNLKLNVNTSFSAYTPVADLDRSHFNTIIDHAIKYDYGLTVATHERKIAQAKVVELINVYNGRWGSTVRTMTSYVQNVIGKQAEKLDVRIDYDRFINSYYNPALNRIEKPWSGSFKFRILFITIRIPKEWFKLGTVAERYFDDEKYALFNALIERDKAIDAENDVRENLTQQVKDTYFTLKQVEAANIDAASNLEKAKNNYDLSIKENKLGLLPFQELYAEKIRFYDQQDANYEALLDYGKTIAMFNLLSSDYLAVQSASNQTTSLTDGDSWISESADEATWYIETLLTDYKFTFGLNIPESVRATHYELYTANHVQIGERTETSNTISHLPLSYEESSALYVKLFQDDELKFVAELDGFGVTGPLLIKEANEDVLPVSMETPVGVWRVTDDNQFRTNFEMTIIEEDILWDEYELIYVETDQLQIGNRRFEPGAVITHLPSTFSEPEKLKVRLYNGGTIIKELTMQIVEDNQGVFIDSANR
jgi:hypothetical protein